MKSSNIQLNDLPDEILLIIFKKLNNISLLYSLMGINARLDKILHDYIFTNTLTLIEDVSCYRTYSLSKLVIDRFCLHILRRIEHKIKRFNLQASSMERVLLSGNYSNLSKLGIYNITKEDALHYFTDQTSLTHLFKNHISSLVVQTIIEKNFSYDENALIFTNIITMFSNLKYLTYDPFEGYCQVISFEKLSPSIFSSTLLELHFKVHDAKDCLYLLDGRFNQLRLFDVKIVSPFSSISQMSKNKLLNLRYFSLSCLTKIYFYDTVILPLLHRMSNLEQLHLYFNCSQEQTFVDGNNLKTNILNHLPLLKTLKFNIFSFIDHYNENNLLSNEDIRNTFKDYSSNEIISCVDYFPDENRGQCHIYSYPFTMTTYQRITNNFSSGSFSCVRKVSLFDEKPFEHEFFIRVQKSFPFMTELTVTNWKSQKEKYKKDNADLALIHYHHLNHLYLTEVHDDYIEQFLLYHKTVLPFNLCLYVDYYSKYEE